MYKIEIDWGIRSPFLRVLRGTVRIDQLDMGLINPKEIEGFPVEKEMNTTGYSNCPAIFTRCKPLVDVMVRSYFEGMLLSDHSVEWFQSCHRKNEQVFLTLND
jgi:hypothetical protein